MRDDNVREFHGCHCQKGDVQLSEDGDGIKIKADFNAVLLPRHARYLARKLYHLARKIERRTVPDTPPVEITPTHGEAK